MSLRILRMSTMKQHSDNHWQTKKKTQKFMNLLINQKVFEIQWSQSSTTAYHETSIKYLIGTLMAEMGQSNCKRRQDTKIHLSYSKTISISVNEY